MFADSIESVAAFTRPIHSIMKRYGDNKIIPGTSTLFFVNEDGWAVTCKHVIELLAASENNNKHFLAFKNERDLLPRDEIFNDLLKGLETKYRYTPESIVQAKHTFMDCVDKISQVTWHLHPLFDLAIIQFHGYEKIRYNGYARFLKESSKIKQGNFLCRLGFPFPEFSNYNYDESSDDINWASTGIQNSPRFPLEGMITRFLAQQNKLYGIELSTPGLKGQSGGPLFDSDGLVYGMQFSTKHLHLGFDILDKEIMINHQEKIVSDYSFLHLGQCIHVDVIKEFLREKGVKFHEA